MIDKIIKIQGLGKFVDFRSSASSYPDNLKKVVAIYADNGSGKSTLAQIIKSLSQPNGEDVLKRKSFIPDAPPINVEFLVNNKKVCFKNNQWSTKALEIEVFDAEFIENNIYVMTLGNHDKPGSFFEIVVGDEAISLFNERRNLISRRKRESVHRRNLKFALKKYGECIKTEIEQKIQLSLEKAQLYTNRIFEIDKRLHDLANEFGEYYISLINEQLEIYAPDLKITNLNKHANKFIYHLAVKGVEIRNDSTSISLRRTLSEGEKNALAFSFFLARLALKSSLENTIVLFDDPINSLDYKRRNATKNKLVSIARKSSQFFLFSHDIYFVRDFSASFSSSDILNLKISTDGKSAFLTEHNVLTDTMTGLFRDLHTLHDFMEHRDKSSYRPIDVARCLRPILEGILRIKYYKTFSRNMWLGDMLKKIRDCGEDDSLYRQKENYYEMTDINEYSSGFHHQEPTYVTQDINSGELHSYCKRTLAIIEKI